MSLSNKYNIPEETLKKMYRDGVISCKWEGYEEVYNNFKTRSSSGKSKNDIYMDIAAEKNISPRTVRLMVETMAKFNA